jgi:diguanylate cyclase (GGDEF)-like protein
MQSKSDIASQTISLLSSADLEKVCANIAKLVQSLTGSPFLAVVIWDGDMETLSDRFVFGSEDNRFKKFLEAFCDRFQPAKEAIRQIGETAGVSELSADWEPLFCYQINQGDELCALMLFKGEKLSDEKMLLKVLEAYPFAIALSRAFQMREMKRENERLRNSYEEIEDKTMLLEEQTRKLIHDLTARDLIRTKHVERERLVYSISNVVRSFVNIQKVLETTVERIGATFAVSRCLLLKAVEGFEQLSVFEYVQSAESVKDLFSTDSGIAFAKVALSSSHPHELVGPTFSDQTVYERLFLTELGIKSGLIVPLVMRDQALGVLFLQDCAEIRHWSIDDISLLGSLADQVSVAIENAELHQEKERQAVTDALTGIANRRSFGDTLAREFERAKRYEQPLSLVVIDLDFLKVINDSFGHQVGDEAIRQIGRILKQSSRSIDLAARYGGEEFCLLLPNTEVNMAEQFAERLRRLINDVHIAGPGHISASMGVASFPAHALDPDTLFRKADEALYEAKQAGRNLVKVVNVTKPAPITSLDSTAGQKANSGKKQ